jgi:tetratricopeptide (TPR) repeat protein
MAGMLLLDQRNPVKRPILLTGLSIALGWLVLFPRVISQTEVDSGIAWFLSYTDLDKAKSMYARPLLQDDWEARGDSVAFASEYRRYVLDYPCWVANRDGLELKKAGRCDKAIPLFERAIALNPVYAAAYTNLGMCLREQGRADSALDILEVAAGLNPYNATIAKELAAVYLMKGRLDDVEENLLWALEIDSDNLDALIGLTQVYRNRRQTDLYLKYLNQLVLHPQVPVVAIQELAEYYLSQRDWGRARELFLKAIPMGLDSTYVRALRQQVPQLGL